MFRATFLFAVKKIHLPSGDHNGFISSAGSEVSLRRSPLARDKTQRSRVSTSGSFNVTTTSCSSGERAGPEYSAASPIVPCSAPLRSTQVNVVFDSESLGARSDFLGCSPPMWFAINHAIPAIKITIMIAAITKPVRCHDAEEGGWL